MTFVHQLPQSILHVSELDQVSYHHSEYELLLAIIIISINLCIEEVKPPWILRVAVIVPLIALIIIVVSATLIFVTFYKIRSE